jgi:hypothetical protein
LKKNSSAPLIDFAVTETHNRKPNMKKPNWISRVLKRLFGRREPGISVEEMVEICKSFPEWMRKNIIIKPSTVKSVNIESVSRYDYGELKELCCQYGISLTEPRVDDQKRRYCFLGKNAAWIRVPLIAESVAPALKTLQDLEREGHIKIIDCNVPDVPESVQYRPYERIGGSTTTYSDKGNPGMTVRMMLKILGFMDKNGKLHEPPVLTKADLMAMADRQKKGRIFYSKSDFFEPPK